MNSLGNAFWLPKGWEAIDRSWGWDVSERSIQGVIFSFHVFIFGLYVVFDWFTFCQEGICVEQHLVLYDFRPGISNIYLYNVLPDIYFP